VFLSAWPGERVCKRCKQSSDWQEPGPLDAL
jgi:hypothetical protein